MDHAKQIDDLAEALASTQAEHATWMEQYDSVVRYGNELLAKNDTAQAQLAEALDLLRKARYLTGYDLDIDDFLARHAQAEQQEAEEYCHACAHRGDNGVCTKHDGPNPRAHAEQQEAGQPDPEQAALGRYAAQVSGERRIKIKSPAHGLQEREAQGAQAGDERAVFLKWFDDYSLAVRMNGGTMNDAQMFDAWEARAALASQPAAGEPVHQVEFRGLDGGGWHDVDRETMELRKAEPKHWHAPTLWTAPPAAAHGGEVEVIATLSVKDYFPNTGLSQPHLDFTWAISPDREREILRTMKGPLKLVAMRAQGDGEVQ